MRLLLIGAPGAGKGTQAVQLAARLGLTHISSGDLLREHVTSGSALGRQVQQLVSQGDLVPDDVVLDMLRKPIVTACETGGYVLDGFPRTLEQAAKAYEVAKELGVAVQLAIFLEVPRDELVRRLLARGRGADDTEEVIEHRLEVYDRKTQPMIAYYAEREQLVTVDGAQSPEQVTESVIKQVEALRPTLAD